MTISLATRTQYAVPSASVSPADQVELLVTATDPTATLVRLFVTAAPAGSTLRERLDETLDKLEARIKEVLDEEPEAAGKTGRLFRMLDGAGELVAVGKLDGETREPRIAAVIAAGNPTVCKRGASECD